MIESCSALESYRARLLGAAARTGFEQHLASCDACRRAVEQTASLNQALAESLERSKTPTANRPAARRLVLAADGQRTARAGRAPAWAWAIPPVAVTLVVSVLAFRSLVPRSRDPVATPSPALSAAVELTVLCARGGEASLTSHGAQGAPAATGGEGRTLTVPGEGQLVVQTGGDVLGLGPRSRAEVLPAHAGRARVRLVSGLVAVEAAHRTGADSLAIDAGGFTVTVVGTRFSVTWDAAGRLDVVVNQGQVKVSQPTGGTRLVDAGQSLHVGPGTEADGALGATSPDEAAALDRALRTTPDPSVPALLTTPLPSPPPADATASASRSEPAPDDATIRKWLLDGDTARAEQVLLARLAVAGRDAGSWWLLGETRRRAGQPREAVAAYRKVMEVGGPADANRARYNAALLLEERLGDGAGAIALYRAYLAGRPHPLESAAQLRLGRLLRKRGDPAGRTVLEDLVRLHPHTAEAEQADRLLSAP